MGESIATYLTALSMCYGEWIFRASPGHSEVTVHAQVPFYSHQFKSASFFLLQSLYSKSASVKAIQRRYDVKTFLESRGGGALWYLGGAYAYTPCPSTMHEGWRISGQTLNDIHSRVATNRGGVAWQY